MIIDYLSFTLKAADFFETYKEGGSVPYRLQGMSWRHDLSFDFADFCQSTVNSFLCCVNRAGHQAEISLKLRDRGMFGYRTSMILMDSDCQQIGVAAFDGNKGSLFISITGRGCRLFDMDVVSSWLKRAGANITRVDIAHDDFEGNYNVRFALDAYYSGQFDLRSRPSARFIDDLGSGAGCTLYVGNPTNGKGCRIYEKGKQLGDKESPWVRWELQFTSRERVIPYDVLTKPASYFIDAYPVFDQIEATQGDVLHRHIKVLKEKKKIRVTRLINYLSVSYGKMIGFMKNELCMSAESIVEKVLRGGVPTSLADDLGYSHYVKELEAYVTC
jgi:phage replication initiation protein